MKWLTRDGLAAAAAVGGAVAWGLGWRGVLLLLAFFISGSLLTQLSGGGGGQRTARQVLANGGVAALAALLGQWTVAAGALAAATADTWATEIGSFSPWPPRMITTGRPVPAGTSGGITALGTVGGSVGAVAIAGLALLLEGPRAGLVTILGVAGVVGMLADSVLGATLQARGWLDNDGVNLAATVTGAAVVLAWP